MKKKSKIFLSLIAVLLLTIGMCGCSSSSQKVDDQFIEALQNGLHARWKLEEANEKSGTGKEPTASDFGKYIDAEYDEVGKFITKTFENEKLEELAVTYIECLEESKDALKYYGTDKWTSEYDNGINLDRMAALYNINKIYPLESLAYSTEYDKNKLKEMLVEGEICDMSNKMISEMKFEITKDDGSYKEAQAVWENTTSSNLAYFDVSVALIDANGVTIDTAHAYVENWSSGEKTLFKFSTNAQFTTMEIRSTSWSL